MIVCGLLSLRVQVTVSMLENREYILLSVTSLFCLFDLFDMPLINLSVVCLERWGTNTLIVNGKGTIY